jgi:hypothetical protein
MFIGALFILPMKETGSKVKALSVIEDAVEERKNPVQNKGDV